MKNIKNFNKEYNFKFKNNKSYDLKECVTLLSEGNVGAVTFLLDIVKYTNENGDIFGWQQIFKEIDLMGLYGSHLYMLYNDCCNRNIRKAIKVIKSYGMLYGDKEIDERIRNVGMGLSFDDILKQQNKNDIFLK